MEGLKVKQLASGAWEAIVIAGGYYATARTKDRVIKMATDWLKAQGKAA